MNRRIISLFFVVVLVLTSFFVIAQEDDDTYQGQMQVSSGQGSIVIVAGSGQTPQHYCGNGIFEA